MGIGKSREGHADVIDADDTRIRVEREVERHGRRHLGDEADIRDAGPLAMAELAARGMLGEQRLDRRQTSAQPMPDPGEPLVIAQLKADLPVCRRFQSPPHRQGVEHENACPMCKSRSTMAIKVLPRPFLAENGNVRIEGGVGQGGEFAP